MIYCHTNIHTNLLITLAAQLASIDSIKVLPLMFTPDSELRLICPCCVLDKRVDTLELTELRSSDSWAGMFKKEKSKNHKLLLEENSKSIVVEDGFTARGVDEYSRRTKYAKIDYPMFRDLGFRGYKFDKNVFFPLAVDLHDAKLRMGIPNPELLYKWPWIQKAAASWMFRVNEVVPVVIPDVLPLSSIGDLHFGEALTHRTVPTRNKSVIVSDFFSTLHKRANKRQYRKLAKEQSLSVAV